MVATPREASTITYARGPDPPGTRLSAGRSSSRSRSDAVGKTSLSPMEILPNDPLIALCLWSDTSYSDTNSASTYYFRKPQKSFNKVELTLVSSSIALPHFS